jgi:hypothetical protein
MNTDNIKDLFITDSNISNFLIKITKTHIIKSKEIIYINILNFFQYS